MSRCAFCGRTPDQAPRPEGWRWTELDPAEALEVCSASCLKLWCARATNGAHLGEVGKACSRCGHVVPKLPVGMCAGAP